VTDVVEVGRQLELITVAASCLWCGTRHCLSRRSVVRVRDLSVAGG
jgi:hypothetical protein